MKILEPLERMRRADDLVNLFSSHVVGEDLFGLTVPAIQRVLESVSSQSKDWLVVVKNCYYDASFDIVDKIIFE